MYRSSLNCQFYFWILVVFDLFCQAVSEFCGDDKYCQAPYKCCANKIACCYDFEQNYSRGFRLHVWNMWYFWLVIIFILMSCFGGCGYYRRRRLAAIRQQSATSSPVSGRSSRSPQQRRQPGDLTQHTVFYAYTGPGADVLHTAQLPPPYAEVMQQPDLYPVNKVELPPYPGPPTQKDPCSRVSEVSPPPYCQVALPTAGAGNGNADGSGSGSQAGVTVPLPMLPVHQMPLNGCPHINIASAGS